MAFPKTTFPRQFGIPFPPATVLSGGDTVAPTVVITSSESSPSAASPIPITITFSEEVTGFTSGDITLDGTVFTSVTDFATADNIVWTANVTVSKIGTGTIDIGAAVCQDGAGNDNEAATQFSCFMTTVTAPGITPTLGSELLTNPGFEGTYDDESGGGGGTVNVAPNWNNYSCETDGTDTLDKETTTVHGGSASQKIIVDATSEGVVSENIAVNVEWYRLSCYLIRNSGTARFLSGGSKLSFSKTTTSGTWVNLLSDGIVLTVGNESIIVSSSGGAADFRADDASIKQFTFSTMISQIGTSTVKDGTYICHPASVVDGTVCGMIIEYLNASNWVAVIVDRAHNTARLYSMIAGVPTLARTGAISYSSGQELKCIVSGTTHQLYYNGTQVGADATIANTGMGVGVYAFSSDGSNTVGSASVNP